MIDLTLSASIFPSKSNGRRLSSLETVEGEGSISDFTLSSASDASKTARFHRVVGYRVATMPLKKVERVSILRLRYHGIPLPIKTSP